MATYMFHLKFRNYVNTKLNIGKKQAEKKPETKQEDIKDKSAI